MTSALAAMAKVDTGRLRGDIDAAFGRALRVWGGDGGGAGEGGSATGVTGKYSGQVLGGVMGAACVREEGRCHFLHAAYCDQLLTRRRRHSEAKEEKEGQNGGGGRGGRGGGGGGGGGESKGGVGGGDEGSLLRAMTNGYMTALRCGLKEGRDQYPRTLWALGEPSMPAEGISEFTATSATLPSWMTLAWTSQMMALVGTQVGESLGPTLCRMARDFPGAVYYPFNISRTSWAQATGEKGETCRDLHARLAGILGNVHIETFIDALEGLQTRTCVGTLGSRRCRRP